MCECINVEHGQGGTQKNSTRANLYCFGKTSFSLLTDVGQKTLVLVMKLDSYTLESLPRRILLLILTSLLCSLNKQNLFPICRNIDSTVEN